MLLNTIIKHGRHAEIGRLSRFAKLSPLAPWRVEGSGSNCLHELPYFELHLGGGLPVVGLDVDRAALPRAAVGQAGRRGKPLEPVLRGRLRADREGGVGQSLRPVRHTPLRSSRLTEPRRPPLGATGQSNRGHRAAARRTLQNQRGIRAPAQSEVGSVARSRVGVSQPRRPPALSQGRGEHPGRQRNGSQRRPKGTGRGPNRFRTRAVDLPLLRRHPHRGHG